jgi:NDP-sugar pyrophosphorylase family protein
MEIKKNKLISFKEKINIKFSYINLGIALIRRKIIKNYSKKRFQKIEEEIFLKTKKFDIQVAKTKSYFIDIGTYKSLELAKKYFR